MNDEIIKIENLSKIYSLKGKKDGILALDNVNLSIKEGETFGLLGPNGAGKTTLIQILTTLLQPTIGKVIIDGHDILKKPKQAKNRVALMLAGDMLYLRITGYQNLKFFCKLYDIKNYDEKINKIVKDFGLEKWINHLVETYSTGMKMKLALCRTLIIERKILFLDEPTVGLDVKTINFFIKKLKELNITIFITSHDITVVEKLCDKIAFINKGKIVKIGTKEDIKILEQSELIIEITIDENKNSLKSELTQQDYIIDIRETSLGFEVELKARTFLKNLFSILSKYYVTKFKEKEMSLEDLFLKLF